MIMDVIVILLVFVDVAALTIGISIRRKVTRIVAETAGQIEEHVKAGIAEALGQLAKVAGELLRAQGKGDVADRILEEIGAQ